MRLFLLLQPYLNKYKKSVHLKIKDYPCEECPSPFSSVKCQFISHCPFRFDKMRSSSRCVLGSIRFLIPCDEGTKHIGLLLRHHSATFGVSLTQVTKVTFSLDLVSFRLLVQDSILSNWPPRRIMTCESSNPSSAERRTGFIASPAAAGSKRDRKLTITRRKCPSKPSATLIQRNIYECFYSTYASIDLIFQKIQ